MEWTNQDWEHEFQKDEIYLVESKKQMEEEWEKSLRKPAKIKILTPLNLNKKHEIKSKSRTV